MKSTPFTTGLTGGNTMSEVSFDRVEVSGKPGLSQAIMYRSTVFTIFVLSFVGLAAGRLFGARARTGLWQEAREAAYAVAGYAFKY